MHYIRPHLKIAPVLWVLATPLQRCYLRYFTNDNHACHVHWIKHLICLIFYRSFRVVILVFGDKANGLFSNPITHIKQRGLTGPRSSHY